MTCAFLRKMCGFLEFCAKRWVGFGIPLSVFNGFFWGLSGCRSCGVRGAERTRSRRNSPEALEFIIQKKVINYLFRNELCFTKLLSVLKYERFGFASISIRICGVSQAKSV